MPFIDHEWYLQQNPDVQRNPVKNHFMRYGRNEGRKPSRDIIIFAVDNIDYHDIRTLVKIIQLFDCTILVYSADTVVKKNDNEKKLEFIRDQLVIQQFEENSRFHTVADTDNKNYDTGKYGIGIRHITDVLNLKGMITLMNSSMIYDDFGAIFSRRNDLIRRSWKSESPYCIDFFGLTKIKQTEQERFPKQHLQSFFITAVSERAALLMIRWFTEFDFNNPPSWQRPFVKDESQLISLRKLVKNDTKISAIMHNEIGFGSCIRSNSMRFEALCEDINFSDPYIWKNWKPRIIFSGTGTTFWGKKTFSF